MFRDDGRPGTGLRTAAAGFGPQAGARPYELQTYPCYLALHRSGELARRAEEAVERMCDCRLCARECGVDRFGQDLGSCRTGRYAVVASYGPHFGEEPPLVGWRGPVLRSFSEGGSGTIFFSNCNLRCLFCQNFDISHLGVGRECTAEEIAQMMLDLQDRGCYNINLVSPSHVVAQFLEALAIAAEAGLRLPIVYNTGGYDSVRTLAELLDGVVDIYMPDAKYADPAIARRISGIEHYPEAMRAALKEMHRQVGDLLVDDRGIARRGMIVRHLVLPGGLAGTREVMEFLACELSPNMYVNVMAQYRPCYRAGDYPPLDRALYRSEYAEAVRIAREAGLTRIEGP